MTAGSDLSLVYSTGRPPGGDIVFRERFKIDPGKPLPEFDLMGAKAYSVTDIKNPTRPIFVRMCEIGVIPRVQTMVRLKPLDDISIMKPLDWGPVYWPLENQRRFAVLFNQPEHGPLMKSLADRVDPMKLDLIVNALFKSALTTLEVFERRNLIHRSIRPDNMYASGLEGAWVQFGDCVTVPPGWGQSPILETIEMGMTPMSSRGPGSSADDMYSLGASVMILAIGHCPVIDMPIKDLIAKKIDVGSFAALLGDERPPLGLREPLRGLLCDDPFERWGLDDIEEFINGEPGRTVSVGRQSRAARGFEFEGDSIRHSRLLAKAFGEDSTAATTAMNGIDFPRWVNRYLDDNTDAESMSDVISELLENALDKQDKFLATRICQILDPLGPMRFQGLVMFPDGLGPVLVESMRTNNSNDMNLIADCIDSGVPLDWMENRENKLLLDQTAAKKTSNASGNS